MTITTNLTLSRQIEILTNHVRKLTKVEITEALAEKVIGWLRDIPTAGRPESLIELLSSKLEISKDTLLLRLGEKITRRDFDDLVPKAGWLHDYIHYTRNTEPPTVFHFFAGLVAIGSALARNVFFDMGAYQIFPNPCVVIIAPSGKCRKTSACNMAVGLYRAVGGNVLADKLTPEALISAFQDRSSATGLIYAPELAVFLGKQKYQEGMVPLLTALFDCPKEWNSSTIMRGESHLNNVALSFLGCSTMDWIQTAIPRDAFGGGFMSRLLFVVQNSTPRSFPHPPPLDLTSAAKLKAKLFAFTKMKGEFKVTPEADAWYVQWYHEKSNVDKAERHFAGYMERKPDHMHRLAMLLTIAELPTEQHVGLTLSLEKMQTALRILDWLEDRLPAAFSEMTQTALGEEHARLIKQLRQNNGLLAHSTWLRMNSNRMNAKQFKDAMDTLRASKLVDYDANKKAYFLTPEGM
jgi:hypothetical protein